MWSQSNQPGRHDKLFEYWCLVVIFSQIAAENNHIISVLLLTSLFGQVKTQDVPLKMKNVRIPFTLPAKERKIFRAECFWPLVSTKHSLKIYSLLILCLTQHKHFAAVFCFCLFFWVFLSLLMMWHPPTRYKIILTCLWIISYSTHVSGMNCNVLILHLIFALPWEHTTLSVPIHKCNY